MKPHEETLVIENGAGHHRGDRWLYAGPEREVGFVSEDAPGGAQQWAVFLAAAPEMARALLHVLACRNPSGRCPSCDRKARHALGLAGVDVP